MKRKLFAISLAAILLLAGCGGGSKTAEDSQAPASSATSDYEGGNYLPDRENYWDMDSAETAPSEPMPAPSTLAGGSEPSSVYQNPGAKLIRRAELNIQTEQFDQSLEALNQLVNNCGGYFESANLYGGGRRDAYATRSGEYVVRIPAQQYNLFLSSTGDLGYVNSKTESSEDVGTQYYDTETRLKTQRTKQERLLALLERAETMEDIISLENALSDVEYQIEMYSSDLRRYDALINFSTFRIYLNEVRQITEEVGETASLGQRMAAGFQASFRGLGQGFQDLLVWVSYNLFLTAVLIGVAVAAVVIGKRELKKVYGKSGKKPEEE
ncbi:MAG: DUF4349 domain-containing protein [Lawsonibacter sp.]|nr:DUF4349 domain-containing protein [Lawsonibacter sp.]MDE6897794.1 DUF4349 domain-containing protein [Lawsonibacter sp.]